MPSSGSCAVLGRPLSVNDTIDPLMKTGSSSLLCPSGRRIKQITHGKCLAPSLALDVQNILPLTLPGPAISCPRHPQVAFSSQPCAPLTQLERMRKEPILWLHCPPSPAPKAGIHGLRSEPGISCVIRSCVRAISFPTKERGLGLGARTAGPWARYCPTHL